MLSPNPHYYEIRGRAAEIARALGSPVGGAEHLFLGMLHDGGWPVSLISGLVDLGQAETAVLGTVHEAETLQFPQSIRPVDESTGHDGCVCGSVAVGRSPVAWMRAPRPW